MFLNYSKLIKPIKRNKIRLFGLIVLLLACCSFYELLNVSNLFAEGVDTSIVPDTIEWATGEVLIYSPSRDKLENGSKVHNPTLWVYGAYWGLIENFSCFITYGVNPHLVTKEIGNDSVRVKEFDRVYSESIEVPFSERPGRPFRRFMFDLELSRDNSRPDFDVNITFCDVLLMLEYRMDLLLTVVEANLQYLFTFGSSIALLAILTVIIAFYVAKYAMNRALYLFELEKLFQVMLSLFLGGLPFICIQAFAISLANARSYLFYLLLSYVVFVFFAVLVSACFFISNRLIRFLPKVHVGKDPVPFSLEPYSIVMVGNNRGKFVKINDSVFDFFRRLLFLRYQFFSPQEFNGSFAVDESSKSSFPLPIDRLLFANETLDAPANVLELGSKKLVLDRWDATLHLTNLLEEYYIFNQYVIEKFMEVSSAKKAEAIMRLLYDLNQDPEYLLEIKSALKLTASRVASLRERLLEVQDFMLEDNLLAIFDRSLELSSKLEEYEKVDQEKSVGSIDNVV